MSWAFKMTGVTKADLENWKSKREDELRSDRGRCTQEACDAAYELSKVDYTLDDSLSFSEFVAYVKDLLSIVPHANLGRSYSVRIELGMAALKCFDRSRHEADVEHLAWLFSTVEEELRQERDTHGSNRWDNKWIEVMTVTLSKNIDILPVESFARFLKNSSSYTVMQIKYDAEPLDNELFDANHCFEYQLAAPRYDDD